MNQDVHRASDKDQSRFASAICAHVAPSGTITGPPHTHKV